MYYIHVKVSTQAKKEKFLQKDKDHFEVSVREKAERNLANIRVLDMLSLYLKIPKGKIRIVNGHHNPSKLMAIEE